jgi:hypothetical protein
MPAKRRCRLGKATIGKCKKPWLEMTKCVHTNRRHLDESDRLLSQYKTANPAKPKQRKFAPMRKSRKNMRIFS